MEEKKIFLIFFIVGEKDIDYRCCGQRKKKLNFLREKKEKKKKNKKEKKK